MVNGGFNGTGTAFIFYIVLALLMPFRQLYLIYKRRRKVPHAFILQHVVMATSLAALALFFIAFAWHHIVRSTTRHVHDLLLASSYMAVATLIIWIIVPHAVMTAHRVRRKKHLFPPANALIHPLPESEALFETSP